MIKASILLLLTSIAGSTTALAEGEKPAAGPRICSSYVDLAKCTNLWKKPTNAPEGADEPIECEAPGGYRAGEQYSAETTWHVVSHEQADFQVSLGPGWSASPVMEFRLCDGRPFAVIQRIQVCDEGKEPCRDHLHSVLIVQGLVGLEGRNAEVPAAPKANEEARKIADSWIAGGGCPAAPQRKKRR